MRIFPLLLFIMILASGCIKKEEFPSLGYNILDDASIEHFEATNVDISFFNSSFRRVRIDYTSIYNQLPAHLASGISGVNVKSPPSLDANIGTDRTFFVHTAAPIGTTVCYELSFILNSGELTRSSSICVDVE